MHRTIYVFVQMHQYIICTKPSICQYDYISRLLLLKETKQIYWMSLEFRKINTI